MTPDIPPPAEGVTELLARAAGVLQERPHPMRFGVYQGAGHVRGDETGVRLCCDLYNNLRTVVSALRLAVALRASPEQLLRLQTGGCTCGVKSPQPECHAPLCVYAAAAELLDSGSFP